jgi:SH3 domain-containing protein
VENVRWIDVLNGGESVSVERGGPWYGDDRRRWLIPAAIGGGVLLLVLLLVGALALRGRNSNPTPTTGARAASPAATRAIVGNVGTPGGTGSSPAATRPATTPTTGAGGATTPTTAGGATRAYVVANTGGDGLNLRRTPGPDGEVITRLPDGTRLESVGADRTVNGVVWRNVRAPDGSEGWVAAEFTQESR